MKYNKYYLFIVIPFTYLLGGCSNTTLNSREQEILQFVRQRTLEEINTANKESEETAETLYRAFSNQGESEETKWYNHLGDYIDRTDQAFNMLAIAEKEVQQSKLTEQFANSLKDTLQKLQTYFIKHIYKYYNYESPDSFIYSNSNILFKDYKDSSFYSIYFKSATKEQALLHITKFRADLLLDKYELIHRYASQTCILEWSKINFFIIPKSNTVDYDSIYQADVFLGRVLIKSPDILFNNKKLEHRRDDFAGHQYLQFPVPKPDHYDSNGLSKQQWTATVVFKKRKADSLVAITRDYYIRKPCK